MDMVRNKMVGSFPKEFYDPYQSGYPLQSGWEIRLDYCKMYVGSNRTILSLLLLKC